MENTVCRPEDVCYNSKDDPIDICGKSPCCNIGEVKKQLIKMFDALPDCAASDVLTELKERGIL